MKLFRRRLSLRSAVLAVLVLALLLWSIGRPSISDDGMHQGIWFSGGLVPVWCVYKYRGINRYDIIIYRSIDPLETSIWFALTVDLYVRTDFHPNQIPG